MTHTTRTPQSPPRSAAAAILDRILVEIDGSTAGFDACRQAAQLATADSEIEAASVIQIAPLVDSHRERMAIERLTAAKKILGPHCRTQRLYGLVVDQLLAEAERVDATLLAIGSPVHRRIEEIALGGVAGELLHGASCSVFIARPAPDLATFPHNVVVGLDGSKEAELAFEVARLLARRRHGTLQGLVALGGKRVHLGKIAHRHPRIETSDRTAVDALVEASACADLVVVGSRGLHGLRALGSVSERVAHQARSSVLVVRTAKEE